MYTIELVICPLHSILTTTRLLASIQLASLETRRVTQQVHCLFLNWLWVLVLTPGYVSVDFISHNAAYEAYYHFLGQTGTFAEKVRIPIVAAVNMLISSRMAFNGHLALSLVYARRTQR